MNERFVTDEQRKKYYIDFFTSTYGNSGAVEHMAERIVSDRNHIDFLINRLADERNKNKDD
jgi:hypothetical protein